MNYLVLIDEENKDVVIKCEDRKQFEYEFGSEDQWNSVGLLDYFTDSSPKYEKYMEISETEADERVKEQSVLINNLYNLLMTALEEKDSTLNKEILFNALNREQAIVFTLFILGKEYTDVHQKEIASIPRLINSVKCLFENTQIQSEMNLLELRVHRNTRKIAINYFTLLLGDGKIGKEKYDIVTDYLKQKIITLDNNQKSVLFG